MTMVPMAEQIEALRKRVHSGSFTPDELMAVPQAVLVELLKVQTAAQVRRRLAVLSKAHDTPCSCPAEHAYECEMGNLMLRSVIAELLWMLGENPKVDEMTADLEAMQESGSGGGPIVVPVEITWRDGP